MEMFDSTRKAFDSLIDLCEELEVDQALQEKIQHCFMTMNKIAESIKKMKVNQCDDVNDVSFSVNSNG
jgi:hypothetical protein